MVLLVNMAVLHKKGSWRARVTSRIFLIGVVIWGTVKILAGEIVSDIQSNTMGLTGGPANCCGKENSLYGDNKSSEPHRA